MPANSYSGNRAIVAPVHAAALYEYTRADSYADVTAIPAGGTSLQLPDHPTDGDAYLWTNPDNTCGAGTPIAIVLSADALAEGITIQGASFASFNTAGASGCAVFMDRSATWAIFNGGVAPPPPPPAGLIGSYSFAAGVVVGDAVYVSASSTVDRALGSSVATMPAVGVVTAIVGPVAEVTYAGEIAGFVGLMPGARYYVSATAAGALTPTAPTTPGDVVQQLGIAKTAGTLVVGAQVLVQI